MSHIPLEQLERRCQKPDHRRIGNFMARRITRPAALRVTRVVIPWGVSANWATLVAWSCGVGAAGALGWGNTGGWLLGAALLQLWYLLDHVDGQLARWHAAASFDGVQLDYLMHHTMNLLVPLGIGWGLFASTCEPLWAAGGLALGVSLLLLTLHHDARYKAFIQRLKRFDGRLEVIGGGGGRPSPQPPVPRKPHKLAAWIARKSCEMHVIINLVTLIALAGWMIDDMRLARIYLAAMVPTAVAVAAWTLIRSQHQGAAEQEFAAWYRDPSAACGFAKNPQPSKPSE